MSHLFRKSTLILLLFILTTSLKSFARTEEEKLFNLYWASYTAMKMSQVQKPQDLLTVFQLTEVDQKHLELEISKLSQETFKNKVISLGEQGTEVIFKNNQQTAVMDFKDFDQKILWINSHRILLDSKKTFFNYRGEIKNAFSEKSKKSAWLFWVFQEARAQRDDDDGIMLAMLSEIGSADMRYYALKNPKRITLSLIPTIYAEEINAWNERRGNRRNDLQFKTLVFTCDDEKHQVKQIKYCNFSKFPTCEKPLQMLTKMQTGYFYFNSCGKLDVDQNGNILLKPRLFLSRQQTDQNELDKKSIDDSEQCAAHPAPKTAFGDTEPFFGFPRVAEACCANRECSAKVAEVLRQKLPTLIQKQMTGRR